MELLHDNMRLVRLRHCDIELVRHWRNDPKISQHMAYREHITREMQERWFETVNNNRNFYFGFICEKVERF